jgi:hypothetical protein
MAEFKELQENCIDIVNQVTTAAPKEVRVIIMLHDAISGKTAMAATIPKEGIAKIFKDYLKNDRSSPHLLGPDGQRLQ